MSAPTPVRARRQVPWQRLSPRMLLVHPLYEMLRELPLLVAAVFFGTTTGNQLVTVLVLWVIAAVGVARWFTTTYRIEPDPQTGRLQLRSGLLRRRVLSVPRNRIRSVSTEARLLHRLLGLTVLRVSTGQEAAGELLFELNAVESSQVSQLRAVLVARGEPGLDQAADQAAVDQPATGQTVLAQWRPSWLRYSPLSLSGLVMIVAAVGAVYQSGVFAALQESAVGRSWLDAAERFGTQRSLLVLAGVLLVVSMLLAVLRSLVTYGNLVLSQAGDVLELRHGLLRVQERSYDMRRLRGGTLRRPLLVRLLGGARLDAAMTGVTGVGESSVLLPPCPAETAEEVLAQLIGDAEPVRGALRPHGAAAVRRRWTRAMLVPVLAAVALGVLTAAGDAATWLLATWLLAAWWWAAWAVLVAGCALLAADRAAALGHRVDARWLVARTGSFERRRYCIETAGIIGWTVRQTWFQRRAGVATLVAATAAGVKAYRVLDVPAEWAWAIAAQASPWVARSPWVRD